MVEKRDGPTKKLSNLKKKKKKSLNNIKFVPS